MPSTGKYTIEKVKPLQGTITLRPPLNSKEKLTNKVKNE